MKLSNTFACLKLSLESKDLFKSFFEESGFPNPLNPSYIHCTLVEAPEVVNIPNGAISTIITINKDTYRYTTFPSGEQNENIALVLAFDSDEIISLHKKINTDFKTTFVHKNFIPHITLSYNLPEDFDISSLPYPDFDIVFDSFEGCEIPDISNLEEELNLLFE